MASLSYTCDSCIVHKPGEAIRKVDQRFCSTDLRFYLRSHLKTDTISYAKLYILFLKYCS